MSQYSYIAIVNILRGQRHCTHPLIVTTSLDTRPLKSTWTSCTNYAHARTVDTRHTFPLFDAPGYEANQLQATVKILVVSTTGLHMYTTCYQFPNMAVRYSTHHAMESKSLLISPLGKSRGQGHLEASVVVWFA